MTIISSLGNIRPLMISFSEIVTCCGVTNRITIAKRKNKIPPARSVGM